MNLKSKSITGKISKKKIETPRESSKPVEDPNLSHIPVMVDQIITHLNPKQGGLFIDATFGMGGHSSLILSYPKTKVIGLDRDASILEKALSENAKLREFSDSKRLSLIHSRFSQMADVLSSPKGMVDGILMDIGVSSVQLDLAGRGFSFREHNDAPLDMRMDQSEKVPTAYDIINTWPEVKLADLIFKYGEEKRSRTLAKAIVDYRRKKPISTTYQLAQILMNAIPRAGAAYKSPEERLSDSCKRTFQALRIQVNQELQELRRGLVAAESLLRPGGKLAVLTFHSLEDRIVKNFLNLSTGKPIESLLSPEIKETLMIREKELKALGRSPSETANSSFIKSITFDSTSEKVLKPTKEELAVNKRAKSAKLRIGTRSGNPAINNWSSWIDG